MFLLDFSKPPPPPSGTRKKSEVSIHQFFFVRVPLGCAYLASCTCFSRTPGLRRSLCTLSDPNTRTLTLKKHESAKPEWPAGTQRVTCKTQHDMMFNNIGYTYLWSTGGDISYIYIYTRYNIYVYNIYYMYCSVLKKPFFLWKHASEKTKNWNCGTCVFLRLWPCWDCAHVWREI